MDNEYSFSMFSNYGKVIKKYNFISFHGTLGFSLVKMSFYLQICDLVFEPSYYFDNVCEKSITFPNFDLEKKKIIQNKIK